jgi:NAD+ synthase (glutamine-hydrolysing)
MAIATKKNDTPSSAALRLPPPARNDRPHPTPHTSGVRDGGLRRCGRMRLALCQMNATVGDIAGNVEKIRAGRAAAIEVEADLVLFGELALTGYPPEDLLLREHFLADAAEALRELAAETQGIVAVVGYPERAEHVYNAAAVLAEGSVHAVYRKVHLPNYGVFDEQRYFHPGPSGAVIDVGEQRMGLTVCEDIWEPGAPTSEEALAGAALILNISASPYHAGKGLQREAMFAQRAREDGACVAFCALVGGQDELVFDGHSFVVDHTGQTIARAAQFREELLICDVDLEAEAAARRGEGNSAPVAVLPGLSVGARAGAGARPPGGSIAELLEPIEAEIYAALRLGLRDYVEKNGFRRVVLGLSGGIDSALVACLAVDALGPERVSVAVMPSQFSSSATQEDARALARALGAQAFELAIEPVYDSYATTLGPAFEGHEHDLTEENLQARIRGNLLMALSNKFGWLVLTTGNKSEMSVGYTTLYGDLAGGFAVIKDVPKTLVYRLCAWRNSSDAAASGGVPSPIPASIMQRAPSAELRPDQRDQDSLPPYELLDRILHGYVELHLGREQLLAQGLPRAEVERTIRLVDLAEYKRRQAPPGIKVTERAFGRDRRMPITNRYRG